MYFNNDAVPNTAIAGNDWKGDYCNTLVPEKYFNLRSRVQVSSTPSSTVTTTAFTTYQWILDKSLLRLPVCTYGPTALRTNVSHLSVLFEVNTFFPVSSFTVSLVVNNCHAARRVDAKEELERNLLALGGESHRAKREARRLSVRDLLGSGPETVLEVTDHLNCYGTGHDK